MKIRIFSLVILSLCLIVTVSPISAEGIYNTYVEMDSYTVHHGENVTVKVEAFSKGGGFLGSDGWLNCKRLHLDVVAKDNNNNLILVIRDRFDLNMWGNGYCTIDTSGLGPGEYAMIVDIPQGYQDGNIYLRSSGTSTLFVT